MMSEVEDAKESPERKLGDMRRNYGAMMQRHEQARERVRQVHSVAAAKAAELEKATGKLVQCRAEIRRLERDMGEVRREMKTHQGRAVKVA